MAGPVGRRVYATDPSKRRSPTKAKAKPKTPRTIDMRSITEGPGGGVRAGVRIVGMAAAKSGVKEAAKSLAKKVATKAQLIGGSGKKAVMKKPAPLGYLKKELPKATHPSTSVGQAFSKRIGFRAREK